MTGNTPISDEARAALAAIIAHEYDVADPDDEGYRPDPSALPSVILTTFSAAPLLVSAEADRYLIDPVHPEATCQRCGRPNIPWFVRSRDWNIAVPDQVGILCPVCFAAAFEDMSGESPVLWELVKAAEKRTPNAELRAEVEGLRAVLAEARDAALLSGDKVLAQQSEIEHGVQIVNDLTVELAALRAAGGQEGDEPKFTVGPDGSVYAAQAGLTLAELGDPSKVAQHVAKRVGIQLPAAPVGGQAEPSDGRTVRPMILSADTPEPPRPWRAVRADDPIVSTYSGQNALGISWAQFLAEWRGGAVYVISAAAAVSGEQATPPSEEQCRRCNGTGGVPFDGDMVECHSCEGTGVGSAPAAGVGGLSAEGGQQ